MNIKSKTIAILLPILLLVFILFGQIRSCEFDQELKESGQLTIGKLDSIRKFPKRTYLCISYYINNEKYNSSESGFKKNISDKDIGKYFKLKYLKKSPEIIRGIYSKQITDTVLILQAGFAKEDIKN